MLETLAFWKGTANELLAEMDAKGGFMVAPSAPSLCQASTDKPLWQAHLDADYAVLDSGYLRLLLLFMGQGASPRISGHQMIDHLLSGSENIAVPFRQRNILWVVPNIEEGGRITRLLATLGFSGSRQKQYLAPEYRRDEDFQDRALLATILEWKPDWIILCIGGGRQEKLGAFLRRELGRKPAIMATGAAIAFFSGGQASIPRLGDRLFLGWLFRIAHDPRRYLPRYWEALSLPLALWRIRRMAVAEPRP
jgi:UDP-N-acetyl-D-mannosaminuronic acid transferase (WecB/TagA/CpsF family)